MPPKNQYATWQYVAIGLVGLLAGLALSVVLYIAACAISFVVTGGGQDPINFLVVIIGWLPALVIGVPLGIIGVARLYNPSKPRN